MSRETRALLVRISISPRVVGTPSRLRGRLSESVETDTLLLCHLRDEINTETPKICSRETTISIG